MDGSTGLTPGEMARAGSVQVHVIVRDDSRTVVRDFTCTLLQAADAFADGLPDGWGAEVIPIDRQTAGLIKSAATYLADGRWFIMQQTEYGTGMAAPAAEDVRDLIETHQLD